MNNAVLNYTRRRMSIENQAIIPPSLFDFHMTLADSYARQRTQPTDLIDDWEDVRYGAQ